MSRLGDACSPLPRRDRSDRHRWREILGAAIDVALPAPCLSCQRRRSATAVGLCASCACRVRPDRRRRCSACFIELEAGRRCLQHGGDLRVPDLLSPFEFRPPLDAVVRALKFGRIPRLASALADLAPPEVLAHLLECDALVPIPLSPWRRWRRGFNQSLVLAQRLGERCGRPVRQPLARRGWRPPQSALPLARRRENVARSFTARRCGRGEKLALVDDVVTSGATLEAASRCLMAAGFAVPLVVALTRTPE